MRARSRLAALVSVLLIACSGPLDRAPGDLPQEVSEVPDTAPEGITHRPAIAKARPIVGGTLLVLGDGITAVAADHDRDRLTVVDLSAGQVLRTIATGQDSAPARMAEDAAGRVHVVLRGSGKVLSFDPATGAILLEREVCAAPRGIAWDPTGDRLHVACATGELVTFPATGGEATRTLRLERDLRDVVVDGSQLLVSYFKSAEVHAIAADGTVAARYAPSGFMTTAMAGPMQSNMTFTSSVAWRMVGRPGGGAVVVHQRGSEDEISTRVPGGYGTGACKSGLVHGTVSTVGSAGVTSGGALPLSVLPVDVAVRADGKAYAVASAGSAQIQLGGAPEQLGLDPVVGCPTEHPALLGNGWVTEPIAVAFDRQDRVVVQNREPAQLVIFRSALSESPQVIPLGGGSVADPGHRLFHAEARAMIACASCHPEGHEDGRVWKFEGFGPRRTQELGGGLLATAPFHWDGDLRDLGHLMETVFVTRMSGPMPVPDDVAALGSWLDRLEAPVADAELDAAQLARGKALFEDQTVGCAGCHSGAQLTNNSTVDVGTGRPLQVPSLKGLAGRGPWMHTGCAATLRERFTNASCGGGELHGRTSHLGETELDDVVAYLRSL